MVRYGNTMRLSQWIETQVVVIPGCAPLGAQARNPTNRVTRGAMDSGFDASHRPGMTGEAGMMREESPKTTKPALAALALRISAGS
jgi:hypothetical protein